MAHLCAEYEAAAPLLRQAQNIIGSEMSRTDKLPWMWGATVSTLLMWDDEGWEWG